MGCKTPGAIYSVIVHNGGSSVSIVASLPYRIVIDQQQTQQLKRRLHKAMEILLSETFDFSGYHQRCYGSNKRSEKRMITKARPDAN
jgi:hypothetical protein